MQFSGGIVLTTIYNRGPVTFPAVVGLGWRAGQLNRLVFCIDSESSIRFDLCRSNLAGNRPYSFAYQSSLRG